MSVRRGAVPFQRNTVVVRQSGRHPDTIDITTASLDAPDAYPPTTEVWLEDRLSWQPTSPDTKKCDGFT